MATVYKWYYFMPFPPGPAKVAEEFAVDRLYVEARPARGRASDNIMVVIMDDIDDGFAPRQSKDMI